jgi:hypothetical protein
MDDFDLAATDDQHPKNLIDRFGKLPDHLQSKCVRADEHQDKNGNQLNPDKYRDDTYQFRDLWQGIMLAKPSGMSNEEAKVFNDLTKNMLNYNPDKWLFTKEILAHS